jgi:hypothetical protein
VSDSNDDDATRKEKIKKKREDASEDIRPHVGQMMAGLPVRLQGLADDFAELISDQNESYYDALSCFTLSQRLNSSSPELRRVHEIARTVLPRDRNAWSDAKRKVDAMYETEDGTGEALAFGRLLSHDPDKAADLDEILRQCAAFYRVPSSYAPIVGEAVTAIVQGEPKIGRELPVTWVHNYMLVVNAIVARCKPDGLIPDRQHRSRY